METKPKQKQVALNQYGMAFIAGTSRETGLELI
jgi:hypothetical protein